MARGSIYSGETNAVPLRILWGFRKPQKGLQLGFLIWGDSWFRRRFRFHAVKLTGGCLRFVFDKGLRIWKFLHTPMPNSARSFCPFFSGWDMWDAQIESVDVSVSSWRLNLSNWGKGETLNARRRRANYAKRQGNIRKHGNVTSQALLPDRLWWIINESISQKYPRTIDTNRCASVPCCWCITPHLGRWWFAAWFQGVGWDPLVSMGWFIGEFAATKIRYAWYLYVCQIEFMMHDVMYELFKKYKELQDLFGIMLGVQDLTGIVRPWHLCMAKALHLSTGSERWDP